MGHGYTEVILKKKKIATGLMKDGGRYGVDKVQTLGECGASAARL